MTYQAALNWIHSRMSFGSRPGLIRVEALLDKLDNPQNKIKTVHIAGTNGKGSTVTDLRCLLEEEGLKVGSFTSPFINYFNERIAINNQPIGNADLVKWVEKIKPLVAELDQDEELAGITQFEIITALMFAYFYEEAVDIAIVEVGLGGLLDSTNVITPLATVITTIGLDHMDILGDSLSEIALQKAGIIKKEVPVVLGGLPEEALSVITIKAAELKAPVIHFNQDYLISHGQSLGLAGEQFTFKNNLLSLEQVKVSLIGTHQIDNAALAIELYCQLADQLNYRVSEAHIRQSLLKAKWSGRFEVIQNEPLMIIDGAHNEPAIDVLVSNCAQLFPEKKIRILFGALQTKDVSQMLGQLSKITNSQLFLTRFDYPKSFEMDDYKQLDLPANSQLVTDWQVSLPELLAKTDSDEVLLVTGSLYFISQVREFILGGQYNETV